MHRQGCPPGHAYGASFLDSALSYALADISWRQDLRSFSLVKRIISSNEAPLELVRNVDYDNKANTCLHLAAELGLFEIADYLLACGHEDNGMSRNVDGVTPLMLAVQMDGDQTDEVAAGRLAVAKLLIDQFSDDTAIIDKAGMSVFHHAARHGNAPILELLLSLAPPSRLVTDEGPDGEQGGPSNALPPVEHPFLHSRDGEGNTALHHASAAGQLKALRVLVIAGADVGAANFRRWTPRDYSATIPAEVYLRGLIKEREHTKAFKQGIAEGVVNTTRIRGPSDVNRGQIRLVKSDTSVATESSDEESVASRTRIRAGT